MTTETLAPFDPLAEAIAAADGWPETPEATETPATAALAALDPAMPAVMKDLLIIAYSGDLEKVWATVHLEGA